MFATKATYGGTTTTDVGRKKSMRMHNKLKRVMLTATLMSAGVMGSRGTMVSASVTPESVLDVNPIVRRSDMQDETAGRLLDKFICQVKNNISCKQNSKGGGYGVSLRLVDEGVEKIKKATVFLLNDPYWYAIFEALSPDTPIWIICDGGKENRMEYITREQMEMGGNSKENLWGIMIYENMITDNRVNMELFAQTFAHEVRHAGIQQKIELLNFRGLNRGSYDIFINYLTAEADTFWQNLEFLRRNPASTNNALRDLRPFSAFYNQLFSEAMSLHGGNQEIALKYARGQMILKALTPTTKSKPNPVSDFLFKHYTTGMCAALINIARSGEGNEIAPAHNPNNVKMLANFCDVSEQEMRDVYLAISKSITNVYCVAQSVEAARLPSGDVDVKRFNKEYARFTDGLQNDFVKNPAAARQKVGQLLNANARLFSVPVSVGTPVNLAVLDGYSR